MDDGRPRNPDSWEPPGFGAAFLGHLLLDAVTAPVVLLLLWLSSLLPAVPDLDPGQLVACVAAVTCGATIVEVLVEGRFARARRLSSPGGWDFALVPTLAASAVVVLLGWSVAGALAAGLAVAVAWAIVEAVEIAWLRPWEPGMTQVEHDAKWAEFTGMTRETFAPDVAEIRRRAEERSMRRYRDAIERKRREEEGTTRDEGRDPSPETS
ncbi:hypothetical protein [Clavibacter sp. Sh2088]|uniref:hypothetical protein n=1 Tax=Clavibacter sp. Sh2088 TaxID=3397676 RepID=UPI0039E10346